jgi:hypothetical protein
LLAEGPIPYKEDPVLTPLQKEALSTLGALGPHVIPPIMHLIENDPQMRIKVDTALYRAPFLLERNTERAQVRNAQLIQSFVENFEETQTALTYILEHGHKSWWGIALKAIIAIGYPKNQAFLPLLIVHAALGMPTGMFALEGILTLKPEIIVPYLLDALWKSSRPEGYEGIELADMAMLFQALEYRAPEQGYVVPCIPALCFLFVQASSQARDPEETSLTSNVLGTLERVGSQVAPLVLPVLIDLLMREKNAELRQRAINLIRSYDSKVIKPYTMVLRTTQVKV